MRYISDKTHEIYETIEALEEAEKLFDEEKARKEAEEAEAKAKREAELAGIKARQEELKAARADRAKEIDEAFKAVRAAEKNYRELVNQFVKDYGYYHASYKSEDELPTVSFSSLFAPFEKFFKF